MSPAIRKRLALVLALVVVVALGLPTTGFAAKGGVTGLDVTGQTAFFAEDMYEPDDTTATAHVYNPAVDGNTFWSHRTFHGVNNEVDDEYDVIAVTVTATDTPIWIETMRIDGWYDTEIFVYDEDGVQLANYDDNDFFYYTYSDSGYFRAPAPGTYYVEVYNLSGYPFAYELFITVGNARRVWGDDRYATSAEVSRLQWDNTGNPYYGTGYGPQHIVIAKGTDPADALAGGSLAAQLEGVLLLTDEDYLPADTYDEIMRVTESRYWDQVEVTVHVLGGTVAVSEGVFEDLQSIRGVTAVYRHFGADRYATAVEVANAMDEEVLIGTTAYIVNGLAWPDALSVAPVAAWDSAPVLMTMFNSVPDVTMDWLADNGITDVVIVGGESVVGPAVYAQLDALYNVDRVFGPTRYETAKEIALHGVNVLGMDGSLATLASGEVFADSLSAAPIAWWTGAPVLLTPKMSLHPAVAAYFDESGEIGTEYMDGIGCYVLGGPAAISEPVYRAFRDHWKVLLP